MKPTLKLNAQTNKNKFVGVVITILIFFMALRIPVDSDFWWHINAGRATINQHSPLLIDIFSFTKFGSAWINHSWLSEIFYFGIYDLFGLTGIMIFVAIIATVTMLLIFNTMKGPVLLRAFLIIFAVMLTAVIWSPRPQLISLLFFALLVSLFQNNEAKFNKKYYIYFSVLFILWSNLHAGFIVGIAYLILVLIGKIIDAFLNKKTITDNISREILNSGILVLISFVSTLINPNGFNIWKVQFNTLNVVALQNFIPEWASPNFHELFQQPFLWVWLLFVALISTGVFSLTFQRLFPLIFFGALGFMSRRNIAPFAIIILPILCDISLAFYNSKLKGNFKIKFAKKIETMNATPKTWVQKIINLSFIFILGVMVSVKIVYLGNSNVMQTYEEITFPYQAINETDIKEFKERNLLNSYTWGGYISWYKPEIKVFVDGRTDLFGDDIILDWIKMVNADEGWVDLFKKYQIGWVLLENERPIVKELLLQRWDLVYQDNVGVILKKP
jgi:hypothetical protein